MKRLLLTHSKFSLQKILLAFSTLFLLLFSNANLNGQCSSGFPAAFPPSPALNTVCQGAAGVYFINGFNSTNFSLILVIFNCQFLYLVILQL